jgi:hypothetical protein
MPQLQSDAIQAMSRAVRRIEVSLGPAVPVPYRHSFVFRYANKGIHEALIQKLARYVSGLNAITVLIDAGYVQEVGVLQRTLDEIQEDIFFLASAETNSSHTDRHRKYLEAFYSEAIFSRDEDSIDIAKPNLVPRKKIRAQTINVLGEGVNVSQALDASESVSTAYSGYVHAASENIMDMYGGVPPHFHLRGMKGTPRISECAEGAENCVYRGLMATIMVAKAFGEASLVDELYKFLVSYESANGRNSPSSTSEARKPLSGST